MKMEMKKIVTVLYFKAIRMIYFNFIILYSINF